MRSRRLEFHVFALVFVLSALLQDGALNASKAGQSPAILSKRVLSFKVQGMCLVDVLLTLAQQEQMPMGIEYVSREALEKPLAENFGQTTVGEIIRALIGGDKGYMWCVRDGVLNVTHRSVASGKENLLDRVLPEFAIPKCSIADASNVLYMDLDRQVRPEVTGYAGEYNPGDRQDLIGPFALRNAPVRQILNRLVSTNKMGAWIVRVPPGRLDHLPSGGLWTIIEYEAAPRRYAEDLRREIFGGGIPPSSKKAQ